MSKKEKKQRARLARKNEKKQKIKKAVAWLLFGVCVFIVGPIGCISVIYYNDRTKEDMTNIRVSDPLSVVCFGTYPQTLVSDEATLTELNALTLNWTYFTDCFTGSGYYGTMKRTNCMKYADVEYMGERYRAVMIEQYRPESVLDPPLTETSWQDDNGYRLNTVYWFAFEPIKWIVFNEANGMLLSEAVLDAMPFNNTFYWIDRNFSGAPDYQNEFSATKYLYLPANLYKTSTLRKWLNGDFYNVAFSKSESRFIKSMLHTANETTEKNRYGFASFTSDKVFLRSADGIVEYYKQDNISDQHASPTDYAKCRGVYATTEQGAEYSWWWLRTPGDASGDVMSVFIDEYVTNTDRQFFYAYIIGGVRCSVFLSAKGMEALQTENDKGGVSIE